jgi:hypothetical protein
MWIEIVGKAYSFIKKRREEEDVMVLCVRVVCVVG